METYDLIHHVQTVQHGFLRPGQVDQLAHDPEHRLTPCLVRCGSCRFTAPAQDVQHLIDIIDRDGTDYVRDVSLPAGAQGAA